MSRFLRLICVLGGLVGLSCAVVESLAQSAVSPETPQNGVVLTKLSQPIYPPLARQTRITGDVDLMLKVRLDGSVESAIVVRGHPLLQQAALDSAQNSEFECRMCDEAATSVRLVYTFQLVGAESCCTLTESKSKNDQADQPIPRVIQSQNHVTVVDQPACICDPAPDVRRVRSSKCLYLWKCGAR
jgi:TonB family protein